MASIGDTINMPSTNLFTQLNATYPIFKSLDAMAPECIKTSSNQNSVDLISFYKNVQDLYTSVSDEFSLKAKLGVGATVGATLDSVLQTTYSSQKQYSSSKLDVIN